MKIALSYRVDMYPFSGQPLSPSQLGRVPASPIETYARCVHRAFEALGHEVTNVYGPHKSWCPQDFDLYMELDNGRAPDGSFAFGDQVLRSDIQLNIPTAVWFVDSHGQPDLHKSLSTIYDHVFFAVWDKRDLFKEHKSAHWCPNATDPAFFYPINTTPEYDFGFFGSKTGLDRADPMIEICNKRGWTYDVRQVGGGSYKHKWPRTCEAMNNCGILFNHGQKHDGPNLRVLESMIVGRPLITDQDTRSGMSQLFEAGVHYYGYDAYTYARLEKQMEAALVNAQLSFKISAAARKLVLEKHLIKNRVEQMLEVFNATL